MALSVAINQVQGVNVSEITLPHDVLVVGRAADQERVIHRRPKGPNFDLWRVGQALHGPRGRVEHVEIELPIGSGQEGDLAAIGRPAGGIVNVGHVGDRCVIRAGDVIENELIVAFLPICVKQIKAIGRPIDPARLAQQTKRLDAAVAQVEEGHFGVRFAVRVLGVDDHAPAVG